MEVTQNPGGQRGPSRKDPCSWFAISKDGLEACSSSVAPGRAAMETGVQEPSQGFWIRTCILIGAPGHSPAQYSLGYVSPGPICARISPYPNHYVPKKYKPLKKPQPQAWPGLKNRAGLHTSHSFQVNFLPQALVVLFVLPIGPNKT